MGPPMQQALHTTRMRARGCSCESSRACCEGTLAERRLHCALSSSPHRTRSSPATVLTMSLIFIGIVVALHLLGRFTA